MIWSILCLFIIYDFYLYLDIDNKKCEMIDSEALGLLCLAIIFVNYSLNSKFIIIEIMK